jgi:hypothetical protein
MLGGKLENDVVIYIPTTYFCQTIFAMTLIRKCPAQFLKFGRIKSPRLVESKRMKKING